MASSSKKDPTISSDRSEGAEGTHPAVPIEEGADSATDREYKDNPDKPDPTSIAQVEVLPEDK